MSSLQKRLSLGQFPHCSKAPFSSAAHASLTISACKDLLAHRCSCQPAIQPLFLLLQQIAARIPAHCPPLPAFEACSAPTCALHCPSSCSAVKTPFPDELQNADSWLLAGSMPGPGRRLESRPRPAQPGSVAKAAHQQMKAGKRSSKLPERDGRQRRLPSRPPDRPPSSNVPCQVCTSYVQGYFGCLYVSLHGAGGKCVALPACKMNLLDNMVSTAK